MKCRHCASSELFPVVDLGYSPPSNAYLRAEDLGKPEIYYPLRVHVCTRCWLVQTEDYADSSQLFAQEYAYFSSTSETWLRHAREYSERISRELGLDRRSLVVELASNDGYLLRNFVSMGIPCLGVEPTAATADAAEKLGIPVVRAFFGEQLGKGLVAERKPADLIIANNVYAHVPDINDFTRGIKALLAANGVATLEFPHLLELLRNTQFDTIYHEHFSYLSLGTVRRIFAECGMKLWKVEKLATHGGSLRVYAAHAGDSRAIDPGIGQVLDEESSFGIGDMRVYHAFAERVHRVKDEFVGFLLECKRKGLRVCAYGAAAKGNTMLNFAGIRADMIGFVCDAAPSKQGKYMPGSHIPILAPEAIRQFRPDIVLVLPWNLIGEIRQSLAYISDWGGRFAIAIPTLKVI